MSVRSVSLFFLCREAGSKGLEILFLQNSFDQFWQFIGRAAEARDTRFRKSFCDLVVERGNAAVGQSQQANDAHARLDHVLHAPDELSLVASFDQVADEEENRLRRVRDESLA